MSRAHVPVQRSRVLVVGWIVCCGWDLDTMSAVAEPNFLRRPVIHDVWSAAANLSIPALTTKRFNKLLSPPRKSIEVAVKTRRKQRPFQDLVSDQTDVVAHASDDKPSVGTPTPVAGPLLEARNTPTEELTDMTPNNPSDRSPPYARVLQASVKAKRPLNHDSGFYYGIPEKVFRKQPAPKPIEISIPQPKVRPPRGDSLSDIMTETLDELREMRNEMEALRQEMIAMKRRLSGTDQDALHPSHKGEDSGLSAMMTRRKKQREFDRIGMEVERWAEKLLFEEDGEENGWKEVQCSKILRNKFNREGNIKCYLKWMKDSRGDQARDDDREYPCLKCYATIDAPVNQVCAYLSDQQRISEYNDLLVDHRDLEEISSHSKICWGLCPQILFIKPRDFVTFCHHRWLRDGTQVVVNQACEHPDAPGSDTESDDNACRAYALRGANFISSDPDDPNKTRFALLAHANPGGNIPQWACKTAVNAVAPIEPFKLFHRINESVKRASPQVEHTEMVGSMPGRSGQPAGLSQMGYACFWPNGGGLKEGFIHPNHPDHVEPLDGHSNRDEESQTHHDGEGS